jgi:hypothetical protein
VVGADLECLVTAHNESRLAGFLVFEETNVTSTTLLPLVRLLDELEKLGAHLEELLLRLLVGLHFNLLGQADNRLKVDILRLRCLVLQLTSA